MPSDEEVKREEAEILRKEEALVQLREQQKKLRSACDSASKNKRSNFNSLAWLLCRLSTHRSRGSQQPKDTSKHKLPLLRLRSSGSNNKFRQSSRA